MGVFAVIFMALYNGKRGPRNQRFFYWFYPLHVYLFYLLSCLMV
ncbi:TraX family protein [Holdemania filiformis]